MSIDPMTSRARLVDVHVPDRPRGVVLVLHGGADRPGNPPTSSTQLSVLRMVPIARRIARAGRGRLAVHRLLNSSRGWNPDRTPVDDVAWAIGEVRRSHGDLPICLVGHSLGGRAALLAGGLDGVVGVVALNPWVYPDDGARADLAGRRVLVVHGTADRIADPARAHRVAADLQRRGVDVTVIDVTDGKHAMLRGAASFERPAAEFVAEVLGV